MKIKPDMQYRLKEDARFVCGGTSFGMSAGAVVQVNQVDTSAHKVLIDFGGGLVDWFDESIFAQRFEAVHQEAEMSGAQKDREEWLASLFPEDRMFEEIKSMASETYRRHRTGVKGRQVSAADNIDHHLIWATKQWIEKNEPAPTAATAERPPTRDRLAEKAMLGLLQGGNVEHRNAGAVARVAYAIADAMLKKRENEGGLE